MPKIDGITYPEGVKAMLKDRVIGPMFRSYLDRKLCGEIYVYIDETSKKRDPMSQYKKFFTPGAKHEINISGPPIETARKLAEKKDWKSKDWTNVYNVADQNVMALANGEHTFKFYKTDEPFKKHHAHMLEKQILRKNYPALMADLNTADKKAVATVAALLKADKKAGERAVTKFTKKTKGAPPPAETKKKIKKFFRIS